MNVWSTILPDIVAGVFAVLTAVIAYLLSTRRARSDLASQLDHIRLQASEARRTTVQQYQLETERRFLEAVGPPSRQVIEAVHDLTDRLFQFFGQHAAQAPTWLTNDGYYRRSLIWLMVRPLGWLEVLRRQQPRVGPTIGTDAIIGHQRFLTACHFFTRGFSTLNIFDGLPYEASKSSAHLFNGTIRQAGEAVVALFPGEFGCITFTEFLERVPRFRDDWLNEFETLLIGVSEGASGDALKRVRMATIYASACFLCRNFPISYRPQPHAETAADVLVAADHPISVRVAHQNLRGWIEEYQRRLDRVSSASVVKASDW